jgi:hypothetical protein
MVQDDSSEKSACSGALDRLRLQALKPKTDEGKVIKLRYLHDFSYKLFLLFLKADAYVKRRGVKNL